ncbi:hypothetical protein V6N12_045757 [Hibiscus sabdariffa]|uniref:Uncharacterized protein n=1 Tax=Hibiscus sabdariffa TaxID=183260 RepID=A0ABR2G4S2_9ROSI
MHGARRGSHLGLPCGLMSPGVVLAWCGWLHPRVTTVRAAFALISECAGCCPRPFSPRFAPMLPLVVSLPWQALGGALLAAPLCRDKVPISSAGRSPR